MVFRVTFYRSEAAARGYWSSYVIPIAMQVELLSCTV